MSIKLRRSRKHIIKGLTLITLYSIAIFVKAEPDPNFHIYLLFGQSNMEGAAPIEAQDRTTNDRVKVMANLNCSNLGRTYGNWYTASPPLNRCWSGLGPGDYFGKTMADGMPSGVTIGLVPAAVSGTPIELYQKTAPIGRNNADIPAQFNSGYAWLLDMAKKAQERGVIKGIIFHQGESNTSDQQWKFKVKEIVTNLREDLNIGEVPFIAGELLYADYNGCCHWHNPEINKLPGMLSNSFVASAAGLPNIPGDGAHFSTASVREFGIRYAQIMLEKIDRTSTLPEPSSSSMSSSTSNTAPSSTSSTAASSIATSSSITAAASSSTAAQASSSSGGGSANGLLLLLMSALLFTPGQNIHRKK
ncbi:sialate O-acetylesterase [Cellvibrio fontiphilus]|uniref:Sialate O-acetylesterase n=1 Tax=Cellvibrio fontiphilus TaxID=1815559 RepID=A0ABV7FI94_9GAMM